MFVENGYKRTLELPSQVDEINYSVSVYNHNVLVVSSNNVDFSITIPKINGTFTKGRNKIIKENNTIYVKQT